jgi:predicted metalloprotease with PDZ domain
LTLLAGALLWSAAAMAQRADEATGQSKPTPAAPSPTIAPSRDVPFPGTIQLSIDTTETPRGIFKVKEVLPVSPGALTLLYPKYVPGNHAPSGPINRIAGLSFSTNGKKLAWIRDAVDVYAFHIDVPKGTSSIDVAFDYLSPTAPDQGRIQTCDVAFDLQWHELLLYPAGYFSRQIIVRPSITLPSGWTAASALSFSGTVSGSNVAFKPVALDTLVDSPVLGGKYLTATSLAENVMFYVAGPNESESHPSALATRELKTLVAQLRRLMGVEHFNHYSFLVSASDRIGPIGLEHHRSTEIGVPANLFSHWTESPASHDVFAHEFFHSWNGKFRRPEGLWTPDFNTPMRGDLLWVYEGLTQFYGNVLSARAGLVSNDDALDIFADVAATLSSQAGRAWRPLVDTTRDPVIAQRRPTPWTDYQRSEDYYREGELVWLDADSLIRQLSGGKQSLDDFTRAFFGGSAGDWGEVTYSLSDIVATLNRVAPYDWARFFAERVYDVAPVAPIGGLTRDGYHLVFNSEPGAWWQSNEKRRKLAADYRYSIGAEVDKDGKISRVNWESPIAKAGVIVGDRITAVNDRVFSDDALRQAIAARDTSGLKLQVRRDDGLRAAAVSYGEGLRYPHLIREQQGSDPLAALLRPLQ